jgi:hypothetical protein
LVIGIAGLLAAPGVARAATVTNGDFETGNLSGWTAENTDTGSFWLVYTGTMTPDLEWTVPAPPQGTHAAVTEQENESREILYQDVHLPAAADAAQLSLFAYYVADGSPFVTPDNLNVDEENEQYRIDVMRPTAPILSVAPGDILATVFRTLPADPPSLVPTLKTADLSAFAGQTVRIRLAVAVTDFELNAGADAVTVSTLTVGKPKLNKDAGTAKLPVTVTDPGTVTLSGKGVKRRSAGADGTLKLLVKPKGKTRSKLDDSGRAKLKLTVTYTPTGSSPISDKAKVKLKKG